MARLARRHRDSDEVRAIPKAVTKIKAMALETKIKKLRKHTARRNLFDVVRYAFRIFAHQSSIVLGSAWAFAGAVLVILVWVLTGPTFHFSDTWQLVINTATTIVTFLMVFLIQNTQNRDTKALHLKLDELLRGVVGARTSFVTLKTSVTKNWKNFNTNSNAFEAGPRTGPSADEGTKADA